MLEDKLTGLSQPLPFFSIIIASYNRAELLKRALGSLLKQTERDFEVILVDDGSTDQTEELAHSSQDQFESLHFIQQENRGVVLAKNRGIFSARGKYLTFLDSDDEYKPHHLALRKELLLDRKNIDLLHGGVEIIGNEFVPDRFDHSKQVHLSDCAISGTFFVKREAASGLNGFATKELKLDGDFMERAINAELNIYKTNLPTYVYHRDTAHSITNDALRPQKEQPVEPFRKV